MCHLEQVTLPLHAQIQWLGGYITVDSVLAVYGTGNLKTLADHSKRVGHCVAVVQFLP